MSERIIECQSLVKNFGNPPIGVLHSLSFTVERGDFMAITGRSGSGKSTLLYVMSGLDNATSGTVLVSGKDIHGMKSKELHAYRNTRMGFVFQFHYLLPELTTVDNILLPARKFGKEKEKRKRAESLMRWFDIADCARKLPSQMSGGEQQRVAIARALIMEPEILFADEPTGNLDSVNGEKVLEIFEQINRESGTTILFVTHELDFAARAGRQLVLKDGRIASLTPSSRRRAGGKT